jgi:excisionase family DNA binding protein
MNAKQKNLGQRNRRNGVPRNDRTSQGAIEPEYLSLAELANYCSVSKKTLRKWLACGMPHFKVSRLVRVNVGEFNAWMRQFRSGTSKDLEEVWDQVIREV